MKSESIFIVTLLAILAVIFVPIPTQAIDLLLLAGFALSLVILLTVVYLHEPLEFSVFPAVLLLTTAYRLAVNLATTRLILGNAGAAGTSAAGRVIEAFGLFVAGNDALVGLILFVILTLVNFIVITRGANRISEVAARFTLDALPGKQMAIDADLNAGLIREDEAKRRRERVGREADFFGAMDGATKFVRGDAIAGILIIVINIVAGLAMGLIRYGMPLTKALKTYTILTIGDGLVSQLPALIVSVSAGLMVSRGGSQGTLAHNFIGQVFSEKKALMVSGLFLALVAAVSIVHPSWLTVELLAAAAVLGGIYFFMRRSEQRGKVEEAKPAASAPSAEDIEGLLRVDPIEIDVGFGLVKWVVPEQGSILLQEVTRIRQQMALDLGIVVPPIRIRDDPRLSSSAYVVRLKGLPVAEGAATEIEALSTQVADVLQRHAAELIARENVAALVKNLRKTHPSLVDELIGEAKPVPTGLLQKVLQNLVRERVSIRDLSTIVETLGEVAPKAKGDLEPATEFVRAALARVVCSRYLSREGKLHVVTLDPKLEDLIRSATDRGAASISPATLARFVAAVTNEISRAQRPVLLCSPAVRGAVRRLLESAGRDVAVLSYNEVPREVRLESVGLITLEEPANV